HALRSAKRRLPTRRFDLCPVPAGTAFPLRACCRRTWHPGAVSVERGRSSIGKPGVATRETSTGFLLPESRNVPHNTRKKRARPQRGAGDSLRAELCPPTTSSQGDPAVPGSWRKKYMPNLQDNVPAAARTSSKAGGSPECSTSSRGSPLQIYRC